MLPLDVLSENRGEPPPNWPAKTLKSAPKFVIEPNVKFDGYVNVAAPYVGGVPVEVWLSAIGCAGFAVGT
jgi:hypothetical protein